MTKSATGSYGSEDVVCCAVRSTGDVSQQRTALYPQTGARTLVVEPFISGPAVVGGELIGKRGLRSGTKKS